MKKHKAFYKSFLCVVLFFGLLIFTACGKAPEKQAEEVAPVEGETDVETPAIIEAAVAELLADPFLFENKEVKIEGVVSQVCLDQGDKIRVLQNDSELSIEVRLGEFSGQFSSESEGQMIVVYGVLKTEIANIEEYKALKHDAEEHVAFETTQQAIEMMKNKGLEPKVNIFIKLSEYEIVLPM